MTLLLTRTMLGNDDEWGDSAAPILSLIQELKDGNCNGVRVKLAPLYQLLLTTSVERIDFLHDFTFTQAPVLDALPLQTYLGFEATATIPLSSVQEFSIELETDSALLLHNLRQSKNIYEQVEILSTLARLHGFDFDTGFAHPQQRLTVANLLDEIYVTAGRRKVWAVVRRVAGLFDRVDPNLTDAVIDILVRQKQISVGRAYSEASLMAQPMSSIEVMEKIREFCREDIRDRVLTQEILIYTSLLIKSAPNLFKGLLTLRVGYLILLLTSNLAQELNITQDEAYEQLMQRSPHEIQMRLRQLLLGYEGFNQALFKQESLHIPKALSIDWVVLPEKPEEEEDWLQKRRTDGSTNRVPKDFYPSVWSVLEHCRGLVIGDKLERRNRLDSNLVLEMTPGKRTLPCKWSIY